MKIRQYKTENFKELEKAIKYLAKLIGVKIPPENDEVIMIVKTLKTGFPDFGSKEIIYAFELAMAGKLTGDDGKVLEVNHYQTYAAEYVCRICRAYRTFRNNAIAQQKKEDEKKRLDEIFAHKVDYAKYSEEMFEGLKTYVIENDELPKVWDWNAAYMHLVEIGRLTKDDYPQLSQIAEQVKVYRRKIAEREFIKTNDKLEWESAIREIEGKGFQTECRKRYLHQYFQLST